MLCIICMYRLVAHFTYAILRWYAMIIIIMYYPSIYNMNVLNIAIIIYTTCWKSIIYLHVNPITLFYVTHCRVFEDRCCNVCMMYKYSVMHADRLAALFARQTRPLNYANPRNICILYTVYSDDTTLNPFNNRLHTPYIILCVYRP